MRKFRDLTEAKDTIVFAFGRFNPPTTGHEKLIQKVASVAGSNPYRIYPSFTQNPKKDPLPHSVKTAYMRKMFRKYAKNIIVDKDAKTAIMIAEKLYKEGYKNLIMVAGSDRVKEFYTLLNRYNDAPDKKGNQLFKFDTVNVVSAGERDPDSEGVEGMSASKMRAAASDRDVDSFLQGVPSGFADGKKLYRDVRKYMGIREEREMGDMTDFETLRDAYLTGKVWNVGDIVEANGLTGEVVRKGTNYLSFMTEDGKVHKAWLHEIELDERNYAKEYQNYHSRPEQIARRSSRNKARRVMGDRTKIGMDVGHKDNNPLNNDPKNLRNEDPTKNRREPRLREKPEIDETAFPWLDRALSKIGQIVHPKGWDAVVKAYVGGMKEPENRKHPSSWASDVSNRYRVAGLTPRSLVKYINTLVAKGKLPKELRAEYVSENMSFSDFVTQIQERELTSNELKRREEIAKDLSDADFKKRYGDRWKEVKMGVATNMAKKEEVELNEKVEGLVKKSEESGISYSILKKVYDRGMAAWNTSHRPGVGQHQWAFARVNSFISGGTTRKTTDSDLWKQHKEEFNDCLLYTSDAADE